MRVLLLFFLILIVMFTTSWMSDLSDDDFYRLKMRPDGRMYVE